MQNDLWYQIALTLVPNIGDVTAKALVNQLGSAEAIFKSSKKDLGSIEGIGSIKANALKTFRDFDKVEEEMLFIEKYNIRPLFITSPDYPQRLLNCYDSPVLLYYKGNANLNASRIISVVGTRNHTEYGRQLCEKFVSDLATEDVIIVSGLAFGIDSIAHKTAVKHEIKTVGVLAHGLDRVYPSQNKLLAKQMIYHGGLLTYFRSKTIPDKQNFPSRNRIAAGICDCIVVIESGKKGGSLITAELGNSYNKDVFACPGRVTDGKSEGCHYLIKNNKAALICSADDVLESMGWKQVKPVKKAIQRELFIELTEEEKAIIDIVQMKEEVHIDELYFQSKLSSSSIAQALLMLEMQGLIASLPGKLYRMS